MSEALRDRLLTLRASLRAQLAELDHLDAGLLALLADAEIVLAALDELHNGDHREEH